MGSVLLCDRLLKAPHLLYHHQEGNYALKEQSLFRNLGGKFLQIQSQESALIKVVCVHALFKRFYYGFFFFKEEAGEIALNTGWRDSTEHFQRSWV